MKEQTDNKLKILYVEDDINLGFVVKDMLEDNGYEVKLCSDGQEAITEFANNHYQLCVLDIMLPTKDGFEVAEFIRQVNKDVPIIFLSAKSLSEDKIKGLKIGADDYITKPFSTEEFLLRVENILKRSGAENTKTDHKDVFQLGEYELNFPEFLLIHSSEQRRLTEREAKLLRILAIHQNQVVTREILLKSVWGKDDYFTGRSMDVFISKLRKYLSADENVKIQVIHGIGFKLQIPEK